MNKQKNVIDTKLHYRMYKSGKQWVYQALAVGVLLFAGGVATMSNPVVSHADTQTTETVDNVHDLTSFYNASVQTANMTPFIAFDNEPNLHQAVADHFNVDKSKVDVFADYDTDSTIKNTGSAYSYVDITMSQQGTVSSSSLNPGYDSYFHTPNPQNGFVARVHEDNGTYKYYYFPSVFIIKTSENNSQYRKGMYMSDSMFSGEKRFTYTEFKKGQSISYDPLNIDDKTASLLNDNVINEYNKGIKLSNGQQIKEIGKHFQAIATLDTNGNLYISNQGFLQGGNGQEFNSSEVKKIILSPNVKYNLIDGGCFASFYNVTEIDNIGTLGTDKFDHNNFGNEAPSMANMFAGMTSLTSLDLSQVDTTNMSTSSMFLGDTSLTTLKLGPKTIINSDAGLPDQYWTNGTEHLFSTQLMDGQSHPGTWVKDPSITDSGALNNQGGKWYVSGNTLHVWNSNPDSVNQNTGDGSGWYYNNFLGSLIGDISANYPQVTKISVDSKVNSQGATTPWAVFSMINLTDGQNPRVSNVEEIDFNNNMSDVHDVNPSSYYGKASAKVTDVEAYFRNLTHLKSVDLSWINSYPGTKADNSQFSQTFENTPALQQITLPKYMSGIGSESGLAEHQWFSVDRGTELATTEDFYKQADQSGTWVNELSPQFNELKLNFIKGKLANTASENSTDLQSSINAQQESDKKTSLPDNIQYDTPKQADLSNDIAKANDEVTKTKAEYDATQNPTSITKSVLDDVSTDTAKMNAAYTVYKNAVLKLTQLQDQQAYNLQFNAKVDDAIAEKQASDKAAQAKAEHDAEIARQKAEEIAKQQAEQKATQAHDAEIARQKAEEQQKQAEAKAQHDAEIARQQAEELKKQQAEQTHETPKPNKVTPHKKATPKHTVKKHSKQARYIKFKRSSKNFVKYQRTLKKHNIKGLDLAFPTLKLINVENTKRGVQFTVKLKGKTLKFFIKSHNDIANAYYKSTDVKHKRSFKIKVLHRVQEHKSTQFTGDDTGRTYKAGTTLKVKKIINNNGITRFKLANGKLITANKYWVSLIK